MDNVRGERKIPLRDGAGKLCIRYGYIVFSWDCGGANRATDK